MKVNVINTSNEVRKYISSLHQGVDCSVAWEEEVLRPYWEELCKYAPFDLSNRKPKAITDIEQLEKECDLLEKLNIANIQKEFERVVSILPNYDDDPITVVLFPGNPLNYKVNEKQNGVVGTSTFGNLFIEVNPLIENYEKWILYVFAHEYHHTVFGNYWFMMHSKELTNQFYESLIVDGEADSFALELYSDLKPLWLFDMNDIDIIELWKNKYKEIIFRTDINYQSYMFGKTEIDIPWCGGYKIGYMLVQSYLKKNNKAILNILELNPSIIVNSYINSNQEDSEI